MHNYYLKPRYIRVAHEPPNELRSRMLGNTNTSKKTLENQKSNFSRSVLFHMRAGVSLRYFVNNCSCIILARYQQKKPPAGAAEEEGTV